MYKIERKIEQYIDGQLSAKEIDDLWAEMIQNGEKLDYLKTAANVKGVIETQNTVRESKVHYFRQYWKYAAAAVIALLIGVLSVINYNTGQKAVKPLPSIELEYYRSANGAATAENNNEVIQDAIAMANRGNTENAIQMLKDQIKKTTDPQHIATLSLNIGSLYYNSGKYSDAVENFKNVINQKNIDVLTLEKGYWFLGNSYFQQGRLNQAQQSIQQAYNLNGAYHRVAGTYLDALKQKTAD